MNSDYNNTSIKISSNIVKIKANEKEIKDDLYIFAVETLNDMNGDVNRNSYSNLNNITKHSSNNQLANQRFDDLISNKTTDISTSNKKMNFNINTSKMHNKHDKYQLTHQEINNKDNNILLCTKQITNQSSTIIDNFTENSKIKSNKERGKKNRSNSVSVTEGN